MPTSHTRATPPVVDEEPLPRFYVAEHKLDRYAVFDSGVQPEEVITQGVDPDAMDEYCRKLNAGEVAESARQRRPRRRSQNDANRRGA